VHTNIDTYKYTYRYTRTNVQAHIQTYKHKRMHRNMHIQRYNSRRWEDVRGIAVHERHWCFKLPHPPARSKFTNVSSCTILHANAPKRATVTFTIAILFVHLLRFRTTSIMRYSTVASLLSCLRVTDNFRPAALLRLGKFFLWQGNLQVIYSAWNAGETKCDRMCRSLHLSFVRFADAKTRMSREAISLSLSLSLSLSRYSCYALWLIGRIL